MVMWLIVLYPHTHLYTYIKIYIEDIWGYNNLTLLPQTTFVLSEGRLYETRDKKWLCEEV